MLYRIELSYACFGVITENNLIIRTPPIATWMMGKRIDTIISWVKTKNGKIIREGFDESNS